MPPQRDQLGERIAGLEAKFDGFDKYTHERWHDLGNTLQSLAMLPEKLTRDIAKLQGTFDGKIDSFRRDIERSIGDAIASALEPVTGDIAKLKAEVDALKEARLQFTGARLVLVWIVQTVIAAATAIGGIIAFKGNHP